VSKEGEEWLSRERVAKMVVRLLATAALFESRHLSKIKNGQRSGHSSPPKKYTKKMPKKGTCLVKLFSAYLKLWFLALVDKFLCVGIPAQMPQLDFIQEPNSEPKRTWIHRQKSECRP
jgi:hypothetical protein